MERRIYTMSVCLPAVLAAVLILCGASADKAYMSDSVNEINKSSAANAASKASVANKSVAVNTAKANKSGAANAASKASAADEVDEVDEECDGSGEIGGKEDTTYPADGKYRFLAVFWNMENFYDYFDGGTNSSDSEFSSGGTRHWNKKRFTDKCNAFGKTMLSIASRYGKLPDVIALAEVENEFVLRRIVNSDVLRKCGYRYVHYDSHDRRGIDVAMLYRPSSVHVAGSRPVHIYTEDGRIMPTRDMLYTKIVIPESVSTTNTSDMSPRPGTGSISGTLHTSDTTHIQDTLHIIVNHHPSKYSGSKSSAGARETAMKALKSLCDSTAEVSDAAIVLTGDFNDTADGVQFSILGEDYENLSVKAGGSGTIRFNGKWETIDHFIVSKAIAGHCTMEIFEAPFLLEKDKAHTGWKPRRTYTGPQYKGGISDHLPIVMVYGF